MMNLSLLTLLIVVILATANKIKAAKNDKGQLQAALVFQTDLSGL